MCCVGDGHGGTGGCVCCVEGAVFPCSLSPFSSFSYSRFLFIFFFLFSFSFVIFYFILCSFSFLFLYFPFSPLYFPSCFFFLVSSPASVLFSFFLISYLFFSYYFSVIPDLPVPTVHQLDGVGGSADHRQRHLLGECGVVHV